ncbi:hypothetical protein [Flavobacterium piscis]|uniref:TonB-dependent receptor plug domain-containing protein n=1 Tax=Flavobacterium piscis TaxID=1114874 RepID=A0ABU1Y943_9FLAO|nr:hypothetical protein [Flavobacterium piscis]MDR7210752.1 hypothetical protein [Flavobacterium piscis]
MDNQDKLFNKFKEASQNAETKDFPAMEKIWLRVEDKLDKKEDKKAISLWKKIAIAASLLLMISLGSQFLTSDKETTIQNTEVVVNEKEDIENQTSKKDNAVVAKKTEIVTKDEAIEILDNQIKQKQKVALQEIQNRNAETIGIGTSVAVSANEVYLPAPVQVQAENSEEENATVKGKMEVMNGYSEIKERESAKVAYAAKQSQMVKKSAPLVVLNGNAISHSDDQKRDKMMQEELPNLRPENLESLVILDEPLYIIDGIYYSENDLFGNNPTSPYAPLNKQEIKTITILQDLEATSKYGEKGKKGVVIITTKTGKPATQK